ncbi:MAG: pilus assembly protein TadG-related protein [Verrucomicrobiota bacterium]|jgi:Flp pilus assembly protein TadG
MNKSDTFRLARLRLSRGSALVTLALMIPIIFLFVGLSIDFGVSYMAQASLAKSVDASCLAGMRNYYQGVAQAQAVALAAFAANYGQPHWGTGTVTPIVTFTTDANNNRFLSVSASATVNTFFIRVIPQWKTLQVSASAQATRANLVMSLALDRSGSMSGNGGGAVLPDAVTSFINYFDDIYDTVGMVSFASAVKNDVAISHPFKAAITSAAHALLFSGATFALGGLTNAFAQIVSVYTPPNENVVKVCVFFTDGFANTSQDPLRHPTLSLLNFGGYDSGTSVGFFDPTTGTQFNFGTYSPTRFYAYQYSASQTVARANVTADAEYRCLKIANAMRANSIIVYCIGLGNNIDQTFLQRIANDPAVPGYVPTSYDGVALFAPSNAQLTEMFELIASKVLLRLSQ